MTDYCPGGHGNGPYVAIYSNPLTGYVYNGTGFEAWNDANYLTYYVQPLAELGASGVFTITTPAAVAALGTYFVVIRKSTGALSTDQILYAGMSCADLQTVQGAAISSSSAVPANVTQIAGQTATAAAPVTFPAVVGSAGDWATATALASVATTIGTPQQAGSAVTLPSIPANWITAASISASALNGKGDWATPATAAAAILVTPAHKLATDASGDVTPTAASITAIQSGVILAANGLDGVATTDPSGASSGWNFRQWLVWLFRRFGKAATSSTANTLTVYGSDGTTALSTQAITTTGTATTDTTGAIP